MAAWVSRQVEMLDGIRHQKKVFDKVLFAVKFKLTNDFQLGFGKFSFPAASCSDKGNSFPSQRTEVQKGPQSAPPWLPATGTFAHFSSLVSLTFHVCQESRFGSL